MSWVSRTAVAWSACMVLCVASVRADDDDAPVEKILPPETLAYFIIPDASAISEAQQRSSTGKLWNEPKLKPFREDVERAYEKIDKMVEDQIGASLSDLVKLLDGEICLAVVEKPARRLAVVLLIEFGDNEKTIDTLLGKMDEALIGAGAKKKTETHGDSEIEVYSLPKGQGDQPNPFRSLCYVRDEGYLTFSTEPAALKAILDRWDGKSDDSLADQEVHQRIAERCEYEEGEAHSKWYINPMGLVQAGIQMSQNAQAAMAISFIPILGLDKLKGIGGTAFAPESGELEGVSKTFLFVEQPASGVLGVLQFPATNLAVPTWVPGNASMYFGVNWDVNGAYESIESLVDSFQAPGTFARIIDGLTEQEGNPGIHLKKDVVDQLSGLIHVFSDGEVTEAGQPASFFVALGVKDAAKVRKTLSSAAKADGSEVKTRSFQGETIYEVEQEVGAVSQKLAIAVAADSLVMTSKPEFVEQMIRGGARADSLQENDVYRRLSKHFPAETSMISFQRPNSQVKAVYEAAKQFDLNSVGVPLDIDFSKLPEFEVIEKYLQASGSWAVPHESGGEVTGIILRNED